MKLLIADDEPSLVKGLKYSLTMEGYDVSVAYDGLEALELAKTNSFDLIVLDVMMPKLDGLDLCTRIREFSTVPIILLTARSQDTDKVLGFDYGADDYMTKPFSLPELKARIRALIRRSAISGHSGAHNTIKYGDIAIDCDSRTVSKGEKAVELTGREFDVLELLMKNPGKVYSRESLLNIICGHEFQSDIRTIDVHIHRLRDKLEDDPTEPKYIMTKWGVGYYFKG